MSACAHVAGALEVDAVLRNLAESAAGLTDAAQAAVVVHGTEAAWAEVVHTGLTDDQFELMRSRVSAPASNGTLCHPLMLDGTPYGELHLFNSARGAFSPEDGELVRALAVTAETALSHARLYDESQRQQDWLRANARIIQQTLSSDGEDPLAVVARVAVGLADADLVTVSLLTEDGTELVVEAGSGQRAEEYVGQRFAVEGTPSGTALAAGTPLPVTDYRALSIEVRTISSDFDAGPVMLVPLVGGQRTWGRHDRGPYPRKARLLTGGPGDGLRLRQPRHDLPGAGRGSRRRAAHAGPRGP